MIFVEEIIEGRRRVGIVHAEGVLTWLDVVGVVGLRAGHLMLREESGVVVRGVRVVVVHSL